MGLLDFNLTPDQNIALGLLGTGMMRGGFAQGGEQALTYLAGAEDRKLKKGLLEMQMQQAQQGLKKGQLELDEYGRKTADADKARQVLSDFYAGRGMPQAPASPPVGIGGAGPQMGVNPPGLMSTQGVGAPPAPMAAPQSPITPKADVWQQYKSLGDMLASRGLVDQAQQYYGLAEKMRPKFGTEPRVMMGPDGKLVNVLVGEDGTTQVLPFGVKPAIKMQDLGGQVVAVDENGLQNGQSFRKSMTPGEQASNAVAWSNNGLAKQRLTLEQSNAQAGKAPTGYRFKEDGQTLEPIPGGPATLGKALPTKLLNDLTEQAQVADNTQRFVATFKPEYGGKTIVGDLDNTSKRILGDETGQAQWWQDYSLHEAQARNKLFGASLTPGEQGAWLKLAVTPRMDPKQIQENLDRRAALERVGLERLTKGAAAGGYNTEQIEAVTGRPLNANKAKAAATAPMKGQVVDGYKFKGGDPANPASWEKQ